MKKSLISLAVAAAMVGGGLISAATASAGTISTSGGTNVTLSGDINYMMGWSSKLGKGLGFDNSFFNSNLAEKGSKLNKTAFASTVNQGSVNLAFSNPKARTSANILIKYDNGSKQFYLKSAYVKHAFNNTYILLGQDDDVFQTPTFSMAVQSPVGANGVGQPGLIEFGDSFNFGSGSSFAPVIGFESNASNMILDNTQTASSTVTLSRTVVPMVAAYLPLNIATSFGSPATVYIEGEIAPVKLAYNNNEYAKTPYSIGGGVSIPISIFTVMANGYHTKGLVGLAGLNPSGNETIGTNVSYVYNPTKNKLITERLTWWNIEGSISPTSNTTIAAGYDSAHFKHSSGGNNYFVPKAVKDAKTVFANVSYNVTNNSTVSFEWDHIRSKYTIAGGIYYGGKNSFTTASGNELFMGYDYTF